MQYPHLLGDLPGFCHFGIAWKKQSTCIREVLMSYDLKRMESIHNFIQTFVGMFLGTHFGLSFLKRLDIFWGDQIGLPSKAQGGWKGSQLVFHPAGWLNKIWWVSLLPFPVRLTLFIWSFLKKKSKTPPVVKLDAVCINILANLTCLCRSASWKKNTQLPVSVCLNDMAWPIHQM